VTIELPDAATSILAEGRQAYLAVASAEGPHVTPELYAWSGGRLWSAVATTTLKAKVVGRHGVAGALVTGRDRSVVLHGRVDAIDLRRPGAWSGPAGVAATSRALARFAARNVDDLVAFGADLVRGRLGASLPAARVVLCFTPEAAALIEGDAVTGRWGAWADVGGGSTASRPVSPAGRPVVVGLPGPLAVPGRWREEEGVVHVLPDVLGVAVAAAEGAVMASRRWWPLGLVDDEYVAPGPAAKRGTLLRGQGRRSGNRGRIEVRIDREVTWDGVRTASRPTP
jgi:hypothetical protein